MQILGRFFREPEQLRALAREAAGWVESGALEVRLWCAAVGTGEEPYTLAMVLDDALRGSTVKFRILATDTSTRALAFAARGRYPRARLERLPPSFAARYFEPDTSLGGADVRVVAALRDRVVFKRLSLSAQPFPLRGGLDAVFCAKALSCLDAPLQTRLAEEIEGLLKPNGLLVAV